MGTNNGRLEQMSMLKPLMAKNNHAEKMTALLKRWTKPGDQHQAQIRNVCVDRQNGHWDTQASNGQVLLTVRRIRHPEGVEPAIYFHLPAEWYWCFQQIETGEDCEPAKRAQIERVPSEVREAIASDPDLGLVEWISVKRLNYIEHGRRRVQRKSKPAPDNVLFFRFSGGLGLAVCEGGVQ